MTVVAIEVTDVGLNAATESGAIGAPSPGYALLDRGEIVLGEPARAAGRLKPRHTNHRFWDRLDQEAVGRPFPRGLTHADLVYAHLSDYWESLRSSLGLELAQTSVLLAIPGAYGPAQVALLLGIVRACDVPVTGLVDAAVAALADRGGSAAEESGSTLHLDISLHRAVWTLVGGGPELDRRRVDVVDSAGLRAFQDAWVRLLAETFVRSTRFDPLHGAATEQALYDRLPAWMEAIRRDGAAEIALEVKGGARSIEVSQDDLVAASDSLLEAIVDTGRELAEVAPRPTVALAAGAARIPGLAARLAAIVEAPPLELPPGAAALGTVRHREVLDRPGQELPLMLGLPGKAHG